MEYNSKDSLKKTSFKIDDKVIVALIRAGTLLIAIVLCKILAIDFSIVAGLLGIDKLWPTLSKVVSKGK